MFATLKRLLGMQDGERPHDPKGHKHKPAMHDPWDGSPMP
jgi:hypothetical protein